MTSPRQLDAADVGSADVVIAAAARRDLRQRAAGTIGEVDQIAIARVEYGRRNRRAPAEQRLVDASVEAEALLGARSGEAELAETLVERRRLVARPDAGAQLRSRLVDMIGRRRPPGVERLAALDRVDPAAEREVEPIEQLEALFGEDRIGDLLGVYRIERAVGGIGS